tara:strand:+ start:47 stop:748 length:702 start_codon:yes stop_codon:yes gene_type:complete
MYKKKKVLVVIPARSKSTGIKNKNIIKLNGIPLLAHSIKYAKKSKVVDEIIVSSDSKKYLKIAKNYGAETPFIREKKLSGNLVTDIPVIKDALIRCEKFYKKKYDYVVLLRPTSPFREKGLIEKSLKLLNKYPKATSVRAVVETTNHPYRTWVYKKGYIYGFVKNKFEPYNIPRQLLPKVMFQTGDIDVTKRRVIMNNSIVGNKVVPLVVKKFINDIDSFNDVIEWKKIHKIK